MIVVPGKLYKVIQTVSLWDVDEHEQTNSGCFLTGEMVNSGAVIMVCEVKHAMSCHKFTNRTPFPQLQLTVLTGKKVRRILLDHQTKSPEEWAEEWLEEYNQ